MHTALIFNGKKQQHFVESAYSVFQSIPIISH